MNEPLGRGFQTFGLLLAIWIFGATASQAQLVDSPVGEAKGSEDEGIQLEVVAEGLNNPCGVAIQPETGAVFVADSGNQRMRPGISTTDQREEGFKLEMAERFPDITVLDTQYNENDASTASSQLQAVLAREPNLGGVFGANLFSALGAANGVEAADKLGDITVVAFDAPTSIVEQLKSGLVDMAIAQHPAEIGYYGVVTAFAHLTGQSVPPMIGTGFTVITADNVEDPEIARFIYSD